MMSMDPIISNGWAKGGETMVVFGNQVSPQELFGLVQYYCVEVGRERNQVADIVACGKVKG